MELSIFVSWIATIITITLCYPKNLLHVSPKCNTDEIRLLLGPLGFNSWVSFTSDFQWCCFTTQGSPAAKQHIVSVDSSSLSLDVTFRYLFFTVMIHWLVMASPCKPNNQACVLVSTTGTNSIPVSIKILPMSPLLLTLVSMLPVVLTVGCQ